jgi:hypothetical protein
MRVFQLHHTVFAYFVRGVTTRRPPRDPRIVTSHTLLIGSRSFSLHTIHMCLLPVVGGVLHPIKMAKSSKFKLSIILPYPKSYILSRPVAMAPSPTPTRRPIPPGLRMTPANKVDNKKGDPKPSGLGDEGISRSTAGTSQENRCMRLTFAPGTNPPQRHIPLKPRTTPANKPNDQQDQPKASESGEEGNRNSTSGTGQENERPTTTVSLGPSHPLRPISPKNKMISAREADDESKANRSGEEDFSSSTSALGQEYSNPSIPSTPRLCHARLANYCGNSDANIILTPKKRKHEQREKVLESEYRRDLLAFEEIDVRDFQAEADAQEGAGEESPKMKKGKATPYESPDRPLVLRDAGLPSGDNIPLRELRARVIAQTGFATHFGRADDNLEEEDLYKPEVG